MSATLDKSPIDKHIMPVRPGCPLLWTKAPGKIQIYHTISANKLEKLLVKNANTEEDNNNGAEKPLTIEERLERRPEETYSKKLIGKKKAGNRGRNHGSCFGDW